MLEGQELSGSSRVLVIITRNFESLLVLVLSPTSGYRKKFSNLAVISTGRTAQVTNKQLIKDPRWNIQVKGTPFETEGDELDARAGMR